MPIYAPPTRPEIAGTPTNAQAKAGFGKLWDYVTSLLGADGDPVNARTALGLGSAATQASSAFATAAQGTKADSALQPAAIGVSVQGYDANTVKKNVATVFTTQQTPAGAAATASAGASYTWNVASAQVLELTFGAGNITTFSVSGMVAKTTYLLYLKQDSVGGRTWATSGIKWPGGVAPTLSVGANAVDIFVFYYDGTSMNGSVFGQGEA